ncbi:MAG TPA: outer membrane protein transport protein [Methylocystis sp.]|nr:outer membrane protein transport protein [Methylocystis sp.]
MQQKFRRALLASLSLAAVAAGTCANANEGLELIGYGVRQKALAGADLAAPDDAMAASSNPAGIIGLPREYQFGMGFLVADRGYEAYGPVSVVAPGYVESGRPLFPIPNGGSVHPIDADSAWAEISYTNGGVNTAYSMWNFRPNVFAPAVAGGGLISLSAGGPFGGGFTGVDLEQEFFSLVYARKFGPVSIGFAPIFAAQAFNAQGLKVFAPYSSNPFHISDNGYDYSFGGGFKIGALWEPIKGFRVALAGTTPMFMTPFSKYSGLIADGGRFDVPADASAGLAYDLTPDLTAMVSWKHIFYSAVPSMSNSSFPIYPGSLGAWNGTGFGWRDVDGESFGLEWRANKQWTLRAGYQHSSSLYGSQSVTTNILAPAVTNHHATAGFSYQITKNSSIDFSTVYAFKNSVSGPEADPYVQFLAFGFFPVTVPPQYRPGTTITNFAYGAEFSIGYNYKFDVGDNSFIPTHF